MKNKQLKQDNLILKQQELKKQVGDLRAEQQKTNNKNTTLKKEFNNLRDISSTMWTQL